MLTVAFVTLCLAQLLFLARYWVRVTERDQDASSIRRMQDGLDWGRQGRRRQKPGTSFLGLQRRR